MDRYGNSTGTHHNRSETVRAGPGYVHALYLSTTAAVEGTTRIRDGGASGTIKFEVDFGNTTFPSQMRGKLPVAVRCMTDIYVELPASHHATVLYE